MPPISLHNIIWVRPENEIQITKGYPFSWRLLARVARQITFGAVIFRLPDGQRYGFGDNDAASKIAHIHINNYVFIWKTWMGGTVGFYESYQDGDWDSPDLAQCLFILAKNTDALHSTFTANPVFGVFNKITHTLNRNSKAGSKRNIMAHYDLGNAFYETWLDPSMTYSSALFPTDTTSLENAQNQKYKSLAKSINLSDKDDVLEIGCGWGGFAEVAAQDFGATVTGITLSKEQYEYAQKRIFKKGLAEKVKFELRDYRDVTTTYSKIASIEMFEAVGEKYWPVYFNKIRDNLHGDGLAGLQIITIADRFFESYRKSSDFIQKYIFPGGMLPSPQRLVLEYKKAGLKSVQAHSFGLDYATTLARWHSAFLNAWQEIQGLPKHNNNKSTFDSQFKKMWRFYLAYCEAGFRAGSTDVCQVTLAKI